MRNLNIGLSKDERHGVIQLSGCRGSICPICWFYQTGEYQLLLESQGWEDIHIIKSTLPRPCPGHCRDIQELSPEIKNHLSKSAQHVFIQKYNEIYDQTEDTLKAEQAAWAEIHEQ
ncbi:MAG: hypothetical protein HC810_02055 [Acaryochloridaceae cyanobacterium RL_2_7]|nr:hypothetical protein [Acaryochloridaceae cyanobacterium RL_2_7]